MTVVLAPQMIGGSIGPPVNEPTGYIAKRYNDPNPGMWTYYLPGDQAALATAVANDAAKNVAPAPLVPTSGQTFQAASGQGIMVLQPASAVATLTVGFPPSPADNQEFVLASQGVVTALTLVGGITLGPALASMSLNQVAIWKFSVTANAWVRLQ